MRYLLFGKTGHLGWYLANDLAQLGDAVAYGSGDVDFRSPGLLDETVRNVSPDVIINAAAYTDVDGAEQSSEEARRVNAEACEELAAAAKDVDALLIHYSTDYVFNGLSETPYSEDDQPDPINVYGRTKLGGEQAIVAAGCKHLIFRTSWVYSSRRESFVSKVLRWARNHSKLRIVVDQVSSPTWSRWLAATTVQLLQTKGADLRENAGLYHLCAKGQAARYDWAQAILELDPFKEEHVYQSLHRALSQDFPTPAQRPSFSVLDTRKFESTFGLNILSWKDMLAQSLHDQFPSQLVS